MAKRELKWVPGLGWFSEFCNQEVEGWVALTDRPPLVMLSGSIFINRRNNKSAVGMMQAAGAEMKRKKVSSVNT